MPSLTAIIRSEARAHRDEDPFKVASRLVSSLSQNQLVVAIGHEIRHEQRSLARGVERSAFPQFFSALKSIPSIIKGKKSDPADVINLQHQIRQKNLMNQAVALGDGTKIKIGRMSPQEHDIRASFLERMSQGIAETAQWHRIAAKQLRKAKVGCLDDLSSIAKQKLEDKLDTLKSKNGEDSLEPAPAT